MSMQIIQLNEQNVTDNKIKSANKNSSAEHKSMIGKLKSFFKKSDKLKTCKLIKKIKENTFESFVTNNCDFCEKRVHFNFQKLFVPNFLRFSKVKN